MFSLTEPTRSFCQLSPPATYEIDIAIDLCGYIEGFRPQIFMRRAAPIQVKYLGYPGTMGAPFIASDALWAFARAGDQIAELESRSNGPTKGA
jgi:hypothetical protein